MMTDDCLNWGGGGVIMADNEIWKEYELEIEGADEMRMHPCLL
jgi:hypothetical protein